MYQHLENHVSHLQGPVSQSLRLTKSLFLHLGGSVRASVPRVTASERWGGLAGKHEQQDMQGLFLSTLCTYLGEWRSHYILVGISHPNLSNCAFASFVHQMEKENCSNHTYTNSGKYSGSLPK